jgi:putative membrane protein
MIKYDPQDWWRVTFSYRGTIIKRIWKRVAALMMLTVLIVIARHYGHPIPDIDHLGHTLIGVAMGLVLVFRNNASYDRYWEGRKCLGGVVAASRNLMRIGHAYAGLNDELAKRLTAYAFALKNHLHSQKRPEEFAAYLPAAEIRVLATSPNFPLFIAASISGLIQGCLKSGRIVAVVAGMMERQVDELLNNQAACERILGTPIPFGHAAHVCQLLIIYLVTLPLVLVPKLGWIAIFAVMFIAFGLMGIEEAGVEIENPFGDEPNDLPVDELCQLIACDTRMIADLPTPQDNLPKEPA